jgi:hypothetical protein
MTPLYHRYHVLSKQRSQNVRTQLWDSIHLPNETLDLSLYLILCVTYWERNAVMALPRRSAPTAMSAAS